MNVITQTNDLLGLAITSGAVSFLAMMLLNLLGRAALDWFSSFLGGLW